MYSYIESSSDPVAGAFIIVPRVTCESCHAFSGPKLVLSELRATPDTNCYPTDLERSLIESNIASARTESKQIDAEISRLMESVDALQRRRVILEQFEIKERSLLSPIRKLPVEILQRILLLAQHRYLKENKIGKWHAGQVAGQVSSYYRSVSLQFPSLWSDISIYILLKNKDKASGLRLFIEKCIRLSKEALLRIRSFHTCTADMLGKHTITQILQNAYRLEEFSDHDGPLVPFIFSSIHDYKFPALKMLSIKCTVGTNHINSTPLLKELSVYSSNYPTAIERITITSAPLLSCVHISNISDPSTVLNTLPWPQIRQLTSYNSTGIYWLLPNMTSLRHLKLLHGWPMGGPYIRIPRLEVLDISAYPDTDPLDTLITPELRSLQLRFDMCPEVSFLLQFIRRSGCSLEELTLGVMDNQRPDSESWDVEEFESIKHLTLSLYDNSTDLQLYRKIVATNPSDGRVAFPGIETLNVEKIFLKRTEDRDSMNTLLEALFSRLTHAYESHSALNRVNITFGKKISGDETIRMRLKQFDISDVVRLSNIQVNIEHGDGPRNRSE